MWGRSAGAFPTAWRDASRALAGHPEMRRVNDEPEVAGSGRPRMGSCEAIRMRGVDRHRVASASNHHRRPPAPKATETPRRRAPVRRHGRDRGAVGLGTRTDPQKVGSGSGRSAEHASGRAPYEAMSLHNIHADFWRGYMPRLGHGESHIRSSPSRGACRATRGPSHPSPLRSEERTLDQSCAHDVGRECRLW